MKVINSTLSKTWAVLWMAVLSLPLVSCFNGKQTDKTTFAADSIQWDDSVKTALSTAYCHIRIDYPSQGDADLLRNVREWISDQLSAETDEQQVSQPDFISRYGKALLDSARNDFLSFERDLHLGTHYEWNITIRKVEETDRYITYLSEIYTYTGGAHGSYVQQGATFRKADGRKFGWDMFKDDTRFELAGLLRDAIHTQYFEPGTDKEFYSQLLDVDTTASRFPLPQFEPYITRDGIHFVYQEYEIAAYAAGSPSCILPFSQVENLLTTSARDLTTQPTP